MGPTINLGPRNTSLSMATMARASCRTCQQMRKTSDGTSLSKPPEKPPRKRFTNKWVKSSLHRHRANQPVIRRNQSNLRFPPAARFGKELSPIVIAKQKAEAWVTIRRRRLLHKLPQTKGLLSHIFLLRKQPQGTSQSSRAIIASTHLHTPLAFTCVGLLVLDSFACQLHCPIRGS